LCGIFSIIDLSKQMMVRRKILRAEVSRRFALDAQNVIRLPFAGETERFGLTADTYGTAPGIRMSCAVCEFSEYGGLGN